MPTFEQTKRGYKNLYAKADVIPSRIADASVLAASAIIKRPIYQEVSKKTGVPWYVIAVIHIRESSANFKGVLHNGQQIIGTGKLTTIVPKGRGPFTSWSEAAIDALCYKGLDKVQRWSLERTLFELERWNGWGYLGKGNSPYIWSWTDLYTGGKYVADHVYDANAVDKQPGCAAILKAIAARDPAVASALRDSEATPPQSVIKDATKEATAKERKTAAGAAAGAGAAGGTKATMEAPSPVEAPVASFGYVYVLPLVIAVFVAIAIIAVVRIKQKTDAIKALW